MKNGKKEMKNCKIEQLCSALLNPPNMQAPEKKLNPPG